MQGNSRHLFKLLRLRGANASATLLAALMILPSCAGSPDEQRFAALRDPAYYDAAMVEHEKEAAFRRIGQDFDAIEPGMARKDVEDRLGQPIDTADWPVNDSRAPIDKGELVFFYVWMPYDPVDSCFSRGAIGIVYRLDRVFHKVLNPFVKR